MGARYALHNALIYKNG